MSEGYLAVDIGTSSIKAVEKSADGAVLRWGILERRNKPFHTGITRMDPADVSKNLADLIAAMGATTRRAVASVPAFLAITVTAEAPDAKYVPASAGTFAFSSAQLGEKYFLAAIPNAVAELYSAIFFKAGLLLESVTLESSAVAAHLGKAIELTLIVDIGDRSTTFTVASEGVARYVAQTDFAVASNAPNVIMEKAKKIAADFNISNTVSCGGEAGLPLCVAHGL